MLWLASEIWLLLLFAFAIGVAVGLWAAAARKNDGATLGAETGYFAAPASEPGILLAAPDGRRDDLTQIIGIDDSTENRLNSLGVFHLSQIAAWSESEARWIEIRLNEPGRVIRERWTEQAAAIA